MKTPKFSTPWATRKNCRGAWVGSRISRFRFRSSASSRAASRPSRWLWPRAALSKRPSAGSSVACSRSSFPRLDRTDRLGLSDRRSALPLVLDPRRSRLGLGNGLDQPARPDLRRCLSQRWCVAVVPRPGGFRRFSRRCHVVDGAIDRSTSDGNDSRPSQCHQ